jgi:hypothetical protein
MAKDARYTQPLPELDDVRGGIQDALTTLGEYTVSAGGNKYFTIQRKPLIINGLAGELSVTWNNLRDADKVAMAEAATIESLRKRLAELEARQGKA